MVTTLTVLKSVHVLAAMFWLGGGFLLTVAMVLAARSQDPARVLATLKLAEFAGPRLFVPFGVVVLLTGIWMTAEYFAFGDLWIVLGLVGTATALAVIVFYVAPRTRALVRTIEQGEGPPKPGRLPLVTRLNVLLVSAVVVIMVIRPG